MPFAHCDCAALSRRRLIGGLLGSCAVLLPGCRASTTVAPSERAALASIARALFPYSFLSDASYEAIVDGVLGAEPRPDPGAVQAAIRSAAPGGRADPRRIPALLATPFGQQFRFAVLVGLYNDLSIVRRFGYQGPSLADGGYLERGFNDLDWLPEPADG